MTTQTDQPTQKSIRIARSALGSDDIVANLSELFHALGDPTRLKLALAQSVRELCVAELASVIGMSESAVSHQLRLLKTLRRFSHLSAFQGPIEWLIANIDKYLPWSDPCS